MNEMWKPVIGFEGIYEVSDQGNIRKADTLKHRSLHCNVHGYLQLILYKNGKKSCKLVHRLVLEAFVGPCPPGYEGRHVNENDPKNCRLDNLAWGTSSDNTQDMLRHRNR